MFVKTLIVVVPALLIGDAVAKHLFNDMAGVITFGIVLWFGTELVHKENV